MPRRRHDKQAVREDVYIQVFFFTFYSFVNFFFLVFCVQRERQEVLRIESVTKESSIEGLAISTASRVIRKTKKWGKTRRGFSFHCFKHRPACSRSSLRPTGLQSCSLSSHRRTGDRHARDHDHHDRHGLGSGSGSGCWSAAGCGQVLYKCINDKR